MTDGHQLYLTIALFKRSEYYFILKCFAIGIATIDSFVDNFPISVTDRSPPWIFQFPHEMTNAD